MTVRRRSPDKIVFGPDWPIYTRRRDSVFLNEMDGWDEYLDYLLLREMMHCVDNNERIRGMSVHLDMCLVRDYVLHPPEFIFDDHD